MFLTQEHPGAIITRYYYDVAEERFQSLPDGGAISQSGRSILSRRYLPGARLTTIVTGAIESRYMRFLGLARDIGRSELALLGVQPHEQYPDLVIACPIVNGPLEIVPSEARHQAKRISHVRPAMGGGMPPLSGQDYPWLIFGSGPNNAGIYSREGGVSNDLRAQLPQTVEACMSVAGLLAVSNPAISRLVNNPNE